MLGQRRRRWANIKTSLFQRVVFDGLGGGGVNTNTVMLKIGERAHHVP